MSLRTYGTYRETNLLWLGAIPENWPSKALKRGASLVTDKATEGSWAVGLENVESWTGKILATESTFEGDGTAFREGDVLYGKLRPYLAKTALADRPGEAVGDFHVVRPSAELAPAFLSYVLRAPAIVSILNGSTFGARMPRVSWDALGMLEIPFPTLPEQAGIAAFLDRETAKIDALVEAQRRLIELLKEKRQALISRVVTKGLDDAIPLKDSGVEWLGEVPAHWTLTTVGRVCNALSYGFTNPMPTSDEGPYMLTANDIGYGLIKFETARKTTWEAYNALTAKSRPQTGDVLVTKDGTLGRVAVHDGQEACINQSVAFLRTIPSIVSAGFLAHALSNGTYQDRMIFEAGGTTIKHIYISRLAKMALAVPPLEEMAEITAWCERSLARADQLIATALQGIELLIERRNALISAAVTGKIDVRGSTAIDAQRAQASVDSATARKLVGSAVLELVADRADGGRVKAQKLIYFAEVHAGVRELGGHYLRMAAGPFDGGLIEETELQLERAHQVAVEQPAGSGGQVLYKVIGTRDRFRADLDQLLGDRKSLFDKTLRDVATLDTRGAEAVATLYAVWNDMLLEGDDPTDDRVVSGFLDDWHPEKRAKFKDADLRIWLGWMRRHDLVPSGQGPRTTTGRLFV